MHRCVGIKYNKMARMGNPPTCKHFGWEDGKNVVVWAHLGEHYNHVKVVPLLHAWNTTRGEWRSG